MKVVVRRAGAGRMTARVSAACAWWLLVAASGLARAEGAPGTAPPGGPHPRQFALVVGNNAPPRAGLSRLRYADDDAVRWAVMFGALGASVEVLTELDPESQRLYGPLASPQGPPTRGALRAAVARIGERIAAARGAGARTVFYFVYAGHGDVEDGQSYLALGDGRLSRTDLVPLVLDPMGADTNHVIVDACRASFFLGIRGPGGERRTWPDAYFAPGARLANTGFLLASSSSGLSHEWEEFQAGIFSHEVRSGLMGPADLNGDRLITYRELTGFVRLANQPVRNERFRPRIVSRAPASRDDVLLDLRNAPAGSVEMRSPAASAHEILEDHAGVRWADFHPGVTGPVRVILPRPGWSPDGFYLRSVSNEAEYVIPAGRDTRLADLAPQPAHALRRGALNDAFTHLFELPFDQSALAEVALEPDLVEEAPAVAPGADLSPRYWTKPVGVGAVTAGAVSLVCAGALVISAVHLRDSGASADGAKRAQINGEIDTRNHQATLAAVGGGVLAALGIGVLIWR